MSLPLFNFILSPFNRQPKPVDDNETETKKEYVPVGIKNFGETSTSTVVANKSTTSLKAAIHPSKTNATTTTKSAKKRRLAKTAKDVQNKKTKYNQRKEGATKRHVRVKGEPMRRSRRTTGYKKGNLSEKKLRSKAWKGRGSREDPFVLTRD